MKFTDEQMIEICRARERLRAYRDKIQPYSELPPEPQIQEPEVWQHTPHIHTYTKKQYSNLIHRVEELEITLAEMRAKKKDVYTIK